jgi:osmoprotectant transport system permease protein
MSAAVIGSFTSDFGDAIDFIFHKRESVSGGIQVGGPNELLHLAGTHMWISAVAVLLACAVSIPIGLYLGHIGKGEFLAISISNIGRAVPSLALLAFFIAYLGLGNKNIIAVLFLLAVPPILTNTYVATTFTVDVRMPPKIVATATIAPLASVNTLGTPIINGNVYGFSGTLGAAIVVALLTLAVDAGLAGAQRAATPKGIKLGRGTAETKRGNFWAIRIRRGEQTT